MGSGSGRSSTKRALIVGIDAYHRTMGLAPLQHAARDAKVLAGMLATHDDGAANWDVETLTDASSEGVGASCSVTGRDLERALDAFFRAEPEPGQPVDLLLYFSGHAGGDYRVQLLGCDGRGYSFNDLWEGVEAASHTARSVTVILDCCTSGALSTVAESNGMLPGKQLPLTNVSILTASMPNEVAMEHPRKGSLFSQQVIGGLRGAAADIQGRVTPMSLYAHAAGAFGAAEQTPTFKSLAVRPTTLRRTVPVVRREHLEKLVDFFGRSVTPKPKLLTPHHEGVEGDRGYIPRGRERLPFTGSAAQIELDYLKVYRDARLLAADDGRDFYFLCMAAKSGLDPAKSTVSLTELGLYYWDLAKRGLLETGD